MSKKADNFGGALYGTIGFAFFIIGLSLLFIKAPLLPPVCPGVFGGISVMLGLFFMLFAMERV